MSTIVICLLAAAATAPAAADAILLVGSNIPLGPCTIEDLHGGQVISLDGRGLRQRRPLEEVRSLSFAGLAALDRAEAALSAGDLEGSLIHLLGAMLEAHTDLQRRWVHVRLARLHDRRGEFVQASRHAAGVWLLDEDPYWRTLEPLTTPQQSAAPSSAAAAEALAVLGQADRKVRQQSLARVIDRLLQDVRGFAGPSANGAPSTVPRTISGLTAQEIRAAIAAADAGAAPRAMPQPAAAAAAAPAPQAAAPTGGAAPPAPQAASEGAADIEALLQEGRFAEALSACRRIAEDVNGRDVAELLYLYGAALAGTGQERDGAVMYMRCAILYPQSTFAAASLIETAIIYRDHYHNAATARRLLGEALRRTDTAGRAALRERAAAELEKTEGG